MNEKRVKLIQIIAPVGIIILVQHAISIFLSQVAIAYVIFRNMPIDVDELSVKYRDFILSQDFLILLNFISGLICSGIFIFWYIRITAKEKEQESVLENGNSLVSIIATILGTVGIAFCCRFVGVFLINLIVMIFPAWLVSYQSALDSIGLSLTGGGSAPPIIVLYTVLIAPIMEEFGFRGISLKYALKGMPGMWANFLQALLFAIIHGNMLQGTYTFLFGLILGLVVIKTGKLWIAILIHIIFNSISIFLPEFVFMGNSPISSYLILFASMTGIYIGVMSMEKVYTKTAK